MRLLSFLTTLLIAVLLASCGGGGGSPGLPTSGTTAFSVAAPGTLTLAVGASQQYVIQGGVTPYRVFSSNPAVSAAWLIGDNVVAVGTAAAGTANVTVQDSKGSAFTMLVTAGSVTAFFTTAPAVLTLAPGPFATQTYKLFGGVPPYHAVSSIPGALSAVVNGSDVTVTALQVPGAGTFTTGLTLTFSDSASPVPTVFTTLVTLGAAIPMEVFPTTITMAIGLTVDLMITGGTPPYHFNTLDQCFSNIQILDGNRLHATANQACTGNVVYVYDSNNQTPLGQPTFTITAGSVGLYISPAALTVPEANNEPDLKLTVYGVKGGSVQVFSTNPAILSPLTPVKNADGTFTITLAGGNTCSLAVTPATPAQLTPTFVPAVPATGGDRSATITVIDALGNIGTSVVTVKDTNGIGGC